jgi:hypothetical protein
MNPTCSHGKRWDEQCEGCESVSLGESLRFLTEQCQRVANELEKKPFMASDPSVMIDLYHTISRLTSTLLRGKLVVLTPTQDPHASGAKVNANILVIDCLKHGRTGPLATSVSCGKCAEEDRQQLLQLRGNLSLAEEGLANAMQEIERLQRALNFWLPGMPAQIDETTELAQRLGDDIYLLAGHEGGLEASAEERGWITLSAQPVTCSDCGVQYVPGARHFSGCKSHPGESVPQLESK